MSMQDELKNGTKRCVCQRSLGRVASLSLAELSFKITFPEPSCRCYSTPAFVFSHFLLHKTDPLSDPAPPHGV